MWNSLMRLPTDVALRTTAGSGSIVTDLAALSSDWIHTTPLQPEDAPIVFDSCLLVGEELDAMVFNAVHGYYRPAVGCLRTALERLTAATGLTAAGDPIRAQQWNAGTEEVPFATGRKLLAAHAALPNLTPAARETLFGGHDHTWSRRLYRTLSNYAHGRAGHTSGDLWASNGPVYVPAALDIVHALARETFTHLHLLLAVGWSGYTASEGLRRAVITPAPEWTNEASLIRTVLDL